MRYQYLMKRTNKQTSEGLCGVRNLIDYIQILHTCSTPLTAIPRKCGKESVDIGATDARCAHREQNGTKLDLAKSIKFMWKNFFGIFSTLK